VSADNPLLRIQDNVPFALVRPEHVRPAVLALLDEGRRKLAALRDTTEPRTYENTVAALEDVTFGLDYAMGIASHLESVLGDSAFREAYNEVQADVATFYSSITLDQGVFRALTTYADTAEAKALPSVRARLLENTIKDLRRNGAALDPERKKRVEAIDVRLTEITLKFSQNAVDASNAFARIVPRAEATRLAGLPPLALKAAEASAQEKGLDGYRLTLDAPSFGPAMMYLEDRALRQELYLAHATRASAEPYDNAPLVREILALRREKATLLGFANFADLVLENRMAKTGRAALAFIERVRGRIEEAFARENRELEAFAREELGLQDLMPWDVAFVAEKERKKRYDLDDEVLRPYFELEAVLGGVFEVSRRLYGLTFELDATGVSTWHPDVREYVVWREQGASRTRVGRFFLDLFPRDGKRDGAWMHGILDRVPGSSQTSAEDSVALIVGNMTKPQDGKVLLTHREVQTVFHEFGHLLHHLLSAVPVRSLAGTKVAWDFVELPSQIMENFCFDAVALGLFARHHETGAPLPEALLQNLQRARGYRAANAIMRQLGFATVDLELHLRDDVEDPVALARELMQRCAPTPLPQSYAMLLSFLHLFSSPVGYAAGYYSYQWAEVLDADAFSLFQELGVLSREAGERFYEHVLSRGDSEDPAVLFRAFRGRDPDEVAALRRAGLVA
jgi:oligopeptidase A